MASSSDPLDLDGPRKRVYRYVERHGPVAPAAVAEAVGLDPETFQHQVTVLKRDGGVEETRDGRLQVPIPVDDAEEFSEAGVDYVVRPARQVDLSGVLGAVRSVAAERTSIVAESVAEQLAYEDTVVRECPTDARVLFVATVAEEVVGWCHAAVPELQKLSGTAEVTVGVLDGYRRHGIGSHLLARGVEWAGARGCRKAYSSLPATNDVGIAFLKRNGWETEAVRSDHYDLNGEYVDEVMLARHIDRPEGDGAGG